MVFVVISRFVPFLNVQKADLGRWRGALPAQGLCSVGRFEYGSGCAVCSTT